MTITVNEKIADIESRLIRMEAQLDMLAKMMMQSAQAPAHVTGQPSGFSKDEAFRRLSEMSQRQVATMLMILAGYRTAAVAERFKVSESTAKIYVSGLMRHLGATTRAQLAIRGKALIEMLNPTEFLESCGVPHDFGENQKKYAKLNIRSLKDKI